MSGEPITLTFREASTLILGALAQLGRVERGVGYDVQITGSVGLDGSADDVQITVTRLSNVVGIDRGRRGT